MKMSLTVMSRDHKLSPQLPFYYFSLQSFWVCYASRVLRELHQTRLTGQLFITQTTLKLSNQQTEPAPEVTQDTNICFNIYHFFFSLSSFLKLCSVKQTCLQLEVVLKQQKNHIIFFQAINSLCEELGFLSYTRNKLWYTHVFLTAVFFLDLCSIVLDELGETRILTGYVKPCPSSIADFYIGFLPSCKARSWPPPLENSSYTDISKFWCHPICTTYQVAFSVFQGPQSEEHRAFWKTFFSLDVRQDEMAI